ncbi:MAG: hypothetical protein WBA72_07845 [Ornithinimicrobium sp.]
MHRRPLRPLTAALAVVALACTACSSAIKVVPFDGADADESCLQLADRWPTTVGGQSARVTAADSTTVAAWGEPAIIARCGAPILGPTTDPCLDIAEVDWVAVPLDDGVRFTTFGRDPALEVLVPDVYTPEALLMPAFSPVAQTVEQTLGQCSS